MALSLDYDYNTGIEMSGMYFRIDKINFNDYAFQVIATGYASEQAYRDGKRPISEPRAYNLMGYDKRDIEQVFQFAYSVLKHHPAFEGADDVLENGQEPIDMLTNTIIEKDENGIRKGSPVIRNNKNEEVPVEESTEGE